MQKIVKQTKQKAIRKAFLSILSARIYLLTIISCSLFHIEFNDKSLAQENNQAESKEAANLNINETKSPDRAIRDKWAVVIGVSKFANKNIPELKFPAKDAKDFAEFLISQGNFARDHVLLLTDEKASKVRILDAFGDGWLPRRVLEDDLVVIFISSHGSPADSANENFVIAYDSDPNKPYATGIRFQDLAAEVKKRTGCDRLVVLLDACHSGAALANESDKKGLVRSLTNFDLNTITGEGELIISSSKPDEVSWESKRYQNGVFTHNLIAALKSDGTQTNLTNAFKSLKESVSQEVRFDRNCTQTPLMLSKWKGSELALCAPPSAPRKVLSEILDDSSMTKSDFKSETVTNSKSKQNNTNTSISNFITKPATTTAPQSSSLSQTTSHQITQSTNTQVINANYISILNPPMMTTSWLHDAGDSTLENGTRLITESELLSLSSKQLLYLYNEAFARHGRGFLTPDIQNYFNTQTWYKVDQTYHFSPTDPKVISRKGQPDDSYIINAKRTPKQWANMQIIKRKMSTKN